MFLTYLTYAYIGYLIVGAVFATLLTVGVRRAVGPVSASGWAALVFATVLFLFPWWPVFIGRQAFMLIGHGLGLIKAPPDSVWELKLSLASYTK